MRIPTVNYLSDVEQFMKKHGQITRTKPELPTVDELLLRGRLIKEEAKEVTDAMEVGNLIEVADGIADLLYVTFGAALVYGLPMEAIFAEVHRSNMSKPKLGHTAQGIKVEKGNYSKPQIAAILELYR